MFTFLHWFGNCSCQKECGCSFDGYRVDVECSQTHSENLDGQLFALFTIVVAVAESAIVLAIILRMVRIYGTTDLNKIEQIKE